MNPANKDTNYTFWFAELKTRIYELQTKAVIAVNSELIRFYWELGRDICLKQDSHSWGDAVIDQLSVDLRKTFPDIKGFSRRNLFYIKRFYLFYNQDVIIVQQAVAQLHDSENFKEKTAKIPWGHNVIIISKCKTTEQALFYISETIKNGWSRVVLDAQIDTNLFERLGSAITNFTETLPKPQSDLAKQTLKDPYIFDILSLKSDIDERNIEDQLTKHITNFLLELGAGFAFVGRQFKVQLSEKERFIDLLFYHLKLRSYIVIELKAGEFEAEHAGKIALYISAIDNTLRTENDNQTIGLILCKKRDKIEAEYVLNAIKHPIGISEYQFSKALPGELKSELPSIEDIEYELSKKSNE